MNLREIPGKTVSAGDELEVQLAPLGDWKQTVEDGAVVRLVRGDKFPEAMHLIAVQYKVNPPPSFVRPIPNPPSFLRWN